MTTVLLVEDNNAIRENICEILELKGYGVCFAINGKTGLEMARKIKPDIILCDILMPEMDGYNVFDGLKESPDTMDIPFIFITGSATKSEVLNGRGKGATAYISKPFDGEDLDTTIQRCLKPEQAEKDGVNII